VRHKPDSVPLIYNGSYHLSNATYPPAAGEQPLITGIFGLAAFRYVPRRCHQRRLWALTSHFHPYPCGRLFSVTRSTNFHLSVLSTGKCSVLSGLSSPERAI